jgi:tripartite-type tricarboxylate transporter receptor subunit TctC
VKRCVEDASRAQRRRKDKQGGGMIRLWLAIIGSVLVCANASAQSHAFPERPIKIIVHLTSGSGSDTAARFFGEKLAAVLGQPVIVENRPSANGVIAVMALKSAPADGYTILLTSISTLSINPVVVKDLPYDPIKDLKPISGLIRTTSVFLAPPDSKANTLAELIALAKTESKPPSYGSYAVGYRLAVEWLAGLTGVKFNNIPYKGAAQMVTDVMGGRLDFAISDLGGVDALIKAGKMKALAVTSEKRQARFPEVQTVIELGYAEYVNYPWIGLHVRAETPDDVTLKLADAMQKVLSTPEAREFAGKTTGTELMPFTPAAMQKYHRDEFERFRRIAENAGIKPE